MELSQIAHALGIETYPPALEELYAAGEFPDPCDRCLLEELETRYGIFGKYYAIVLQALETLPQDPNRYAWAQVVSTYIATAPVELASKVPMPATDGTPAGDLLPMLILLTQIPRSEEAYRSRGFSGQQLLTVMTSYGRIIALVEKSLGRPAINQLYYQWLCLYAKATIFHCGSFQFEVRRLSDAAMYLQNRNTGALVSVMTSGTFHRSGQVLGSGGCSDTAGSFCATVRETEDAWYGFPATEHAVTQQEVCFPKAQWVCALQPGDTVLNMHISRGADLSQASVDAAIAEAVAIAERSYPEWTSHGIHCHSWLLDPLLRDILGASSNIARFGDRFCRHPIQSAGRNGFSYVFPPGVPDAQLPENTRLQKGLKAHYLSGGCLYGCAGAFITKEG